MLEVINAGPIELPRRERENTIVMNCWENASPLIKELERTVNFAERKCGDLMQQLHFYKEYYEKWMQAGHLNASICQKRKIKKCYKQTPDTDSSSENEFEKVNRYFYKKIKSKITEMNKEISQANRKLNNKIENFDSPEKNEKPRPVAVENVDAEEDVKEEISHDNKACRSEPIMTVQNEETQMSGAGPEKNDQATSLTTKLSIKSVPIRKKDMKKRDLLPLRKYSNLQRYKLRSKSLPQGVRRKFGFGGFIEIFDPKLKLQNARSKSKITLKTESCKSFKIFKCDDQSKIAKRESLKKGLLRKVRRNPPTSSRSLQLRVTKAETDTRPNTETGQLNLLKDVDREQVPSRNFDKMSCVRSTISHSNNSGKLISDDHCKEIVPSRNVAKTTGDSNLNFVGNLTHLISKPKALMPFLRQPIPFIPCSSTSKSFNLGLNIQQVLSLIKHKKHSITLQTIIKNDMQAARSVTDQPLPTVNTLFFSHTTTRHGQVSSALCPARTCIEDTFSIVTDNVSCHSNCSLLKRAQAIRSEVMEGRKVQHFQDGDLNLEEKVQVNKFSRPEDVWVVEQPDTNSTSCTKSRSKCTCFPSKHCVDYHKLLREYTGWRSSPSKAASLSSDGYSSYHPLLSCQKPKLRTITSQENVNCDQRDDGKIELFKVHNDIINLNRKYSHLEEQISLKNLDDFEASAELEAIESEVSVRETELKEILNFYRQLILLKDKIKGLKTRTANSLNRAVCPQPQYQRPKKDPLRPTPSMTLANVLRKIQGLQDKIKLIDAP